MKKRLLLLLAAATLVFQSCEDDNNNGAAVNAEVQKAFTARFPDARNVEWETKSTYAVADFKTGNTDVTAWFDQTGTWYMTETDMTYAALPQAVQTAFKASAYAAWTVDDVDRIERQDAETIYVIETEQGNSDADLYYTTAGVLTKVLLDTEGNDDHEGLIPSQLPAAIKTYIDTHYPGSQLIETDHENGLTEVEIVDGRTVREVTFNASNDWVSTQSDILRSDVPQPVMQAIAASAYASYEIDDIDLVETPAGTWYAVELEEEASDKEILLKITAEGTIL